MKFKKITAFIGGALMLVSTIGMATAASFPAPFVQSGADGVAIVYGTGAGVSAIDQQSATSIQTTLAEAMPKTGGTVTGGEAFKLDKSSDHFNFNNALNSVYSDIDEEQMPIFLAEGTYNDGDVEEDYSQKITLGSKTLSLFADNDYEDDTPTVGFRWTNAETILTYEFNLDDGVAYTQLVDTNMPLLGREYYVLAASTTQIDILDSAEKTILTQGDEITFAGKTVSIAFIDSTDVKFNVDGEVTDKIAENGYEELQDGSYIVVNSNLYDSKDSGVSQVEFSIGAGKLELIDGEEIELNTEDIDGLSVAFTDDSSNSSELDTITITWASDRETYLTEEEAIAMPGFEAIKLAFGGLMFPTESEMIGLENGETLTLTMDNFDLPIAWYDGTDAFMGEESYELVVATSIATNDTWTSPARTANLTGGLDLEENDRFIVTSIGTDLTDVETMYYEVTSVENDSNVIEVVLEDLLGNNDLTFDELESHDKGALTATLVGVNGSISGRAYINFSSSDATVYYNKVVSDTGMVITLPTDVSSVDTSTGAFITFAEADKDEDLAEGTAFNVTFKATANNKLHVSTHNLTAYDEEESNDVYIGYVPSNLASKLTFDTSADEYDFSVEYFGEEVTADVTVASADAVISGAASLGNVMYKDSEVNSYKDKDLIIVGGSCINSAAATALGVDEHTCGAAFTAATTVGVDQFLIQSVADAFTSGKIAIVVAGYETEDTTAAATYLRTQDVDTTAGEKHVYATSTNTEVTEM